jgi:DNA-binding HxlR family transcriptional regulator
VGEPDGLGHGQPLVTGRSIARTLKVIGDRWSSLILRSSFFGTRRFDDFRRELGIAESILAQRLGRLVALGVLTRRAYQGNPPRDEYLLTDAGLDLYPIYLSMLAWGDRWLADGSDATMVLEHKLCGHSVEPVLVCAACQAALHRGSITRADR